MLLEILTMIRSLRHIIKGGGIILILGRETNLKGNQTSIIFRVVLIKITSTTNSPGTLTVLFRRPELHFRTWRYKWVSSVSKYLRRHPTLFLVTQCLIQEKSARPSQWQVSQ
ncbi:hypothetical protein AHAS_Ahas02G0115700 [Arachis hypogaea]